MLYNFENSKDVFDARLYLKKLVDKKSLIEIKKVSPKRSLRQNSYIHLTFSIFGIETGFTANESKLIFKKYANPELFIYKKNGEVFLKSSADLTTSEMTTAVDKWRMYAADKGIDIPLPTDQESLSYWGNQIEERGRYL